MCIRNFSDAPESKPDLPKKATDTMTPYSVVIDDFKITNLKHGQVLIAHVDGESMVTTQKKLGEAIEKFWQAEF